jgi:hypothetical protein
LTGILRISKEGMFWDLNNLTVYSMLSSFYGQYFGFTEEEVDWVCEQASLVNQRDSVRLWYNGYKFGDLNIYNPWSIINFAKNRTLEPYWVNTGSSAIIEALIAKTSDHFKSDFEVLIQGGILTKSIDERIVLPEINSNAEDAIWSFLLFSGYLKVLAIEYKGIKASCSVAIHNQEIKYLYEEQLSSLFNSSAFSPENYARMLNAFIDGNTTSFSNYLQQYLDTSMSYFDAGRQEPERFYHGFVLGALVALKETHDVRSNRESGDGRYDIMVIPKDRSKIGIILEFKIAESDSPESMTKALDEAFEQINNHGYEAELKALSIQKILKIGAVFYKKKMIMRTISSF